jgi:uncharacterized membrane protein
MEERGPIDPISAQRVQTAGAGTALGTQGADGGAADRVAIDSPQIAGAGAWSTPPPLSQDRLAAFSDGVFAVAITLLVFGIPTPHPAAGKLGHALIDLWPSYAAYAISFLTIGIIWVNHHGTFARVARVDRPLLFVNLILLMTVCFVPFPTSLLSRFVANGGADATVSAFVYAATMTAMSLAFGGMWVYAIRQGLLHPEHSDPRYTRRAIIRFSGGGVIYALSMGIAVVSPLVDLLIFALLALYYVFDQQG